MLYRIKRNSLELLKKKKENNVSLNNCCLYGRSRIVRNPDVNYNILQNIWNNLALLIQQTAMEITYFLPTLNLKIMDWLDQAAESTDSASRVCFVNY